MQDQVSASLIKANDEAKEMKTHDDVTSVSDWMTSFFLLHQLVQRAFHLAPRTHLSGDRMSRRNFSERCAEHPRSRWKSLMTSCSSIGSLNHNFSLSTSKPPQLTLFLTKWTKSRYRSQFRLSALTGLADVPKCAATQPPFLRNFVLNNPTTSHNFSLF